MNDDSDELSDGAGPKMRNNGYMMTNKQRLYKLQHHVNEIIGALESLGYEIPVKDPETLSSRHDIVDWLGTICEDVSYAVGCIERDLGIVRDKETEAEKSINAKANRLLDQLRFHGIIQDQHETVALRSRVRSLITDGVEPRMPDASE